VVDLIQYIEILEYAEFALEKWQMKVNYQESRNQAGKILLLKAKL
jgi:hypothetical protein